MLFNRILFLRFLRIIKNLKKGLDFYAAKYYNRYNVYFKAIKFLIIKGAVIL